jgi:hypothetical protein
VVSCGVIRTKNPPVTAGLSLTLSGERYAASRAGVAFILIVLPVTALLLILPISCLSIANYTPSLPASYRHRSNATG